MHTIHAFVISWPGQEENAERIANQALGVAEHVTVLHSCEDADRLPERPGWIQLPMAEFYGAKFARSLAMNRGDVMLHLHADARTGDWAQVIRHCREVHDSVANVGIWGCDLHFTPFPTEEVCIGAADAQVVAVAQTDAVVWSLSAPVLERLRGLDLSLTPLGWGIDWAAISFCVANGLLVLRDCRVKLEHPRGTGYDRAEAERQMLRFLQQLTPAEQVARVLLQRHIAFSRRLLGRPAAGL